MSAESAPTWYVGSTLHCRVDPPDVLAEQAEADQLHAAEEQDRNEFDVQPGMVDRAR